MTLAAGAEKLNENVVHLHGRPAPVSNPIDESIAGLRAEVAALRADHARQAQTIETLLREIAAAAGGRAGAPQRVPAVERRQSKKLAADMLGISKAKLMGIIAEHDEKYPDRPPLAVQPGGSKYKAWIVFTDRVQAFMDAGAAY